MASSSYVDLGDSGDAFLFSSGSPSAVTSHSVTIDGLVCGSTYSYQVFSAVGGSGSTSSSGTFSTSSCSGGAGITLVGSTETDGNDGSEPGITVTLPSGIEANDQIIVTVTTMASSTPSTPTGYTLVSDTTTGISYNPRVMVFRATAAGGESSVFVDTGYVWAEASAAVYRGVSTTTPIDGVTGTTAGGYSLAADAITPSVPGEVLVLAEGSTTGSSSEPGWSAPSGWTQEADNTSWSYVSSGLADTTPQPLAGGSSSPTPTFGAYDDLAVVQFGLEPAVSTSTAYAYDSIGDRISTTVGSASPSTYTYDQIGELTGATPAGGSAYNYAYNGDGLRMSKTVSSTTESFTYDPLSTALLQDGSNYYVYGADGLPLEKINGTTPLYYLHDQIGSTRVLTNGSGTVVDTYTYDPYGNLLGSTGSDSNPFGYAGSYTDAETGFLYLIHRYYDPTTGQFVSVDPLVDETGRPYAYTGDDPVNGVDPLGLSPWGWVANQATKAWNDTGGKVVHAVATHTIGLCLNVSAGWGPYGTASGCVALSGGHFTLVGAAGGGGSSPTASATLGLLISNASKPSDLRGPFAGGGGSADLGLSAGEEGSVGTGSCNQTIWENQVTAGLGLDLPIPFEGHGGATYTWTWSP